MIEKACGLMLLRRVNWHLSPPKGCGCSDRATLTGIDIPTIYARYRGVDGEVVWPESPKERLNLFDAGLRPSTSLDEFVRLRARQQCEEPVDLLYCNWQTPDSPHSNSASPNFRPLGFDVAMPITTETRFGFSAIFQDILFGAYGELAGFVTRLNQNLLFERIEDAQEFIQLRDHLGEAGADLEVSTEGAELLPVSIHLYEGPTNSVVVTC